MRHAVNPSLHPRRASPPPRAGAAECHLHARRWQYRSTTGTVHGQPMSPRKGRHVVKGLDRQHTALVSCRAICARRVAASCLDAGRRISAELCGSKAMSGPRVIGWVGVDRGYPHEDDDADVSARIPRSAAHAWPIATRLFGLGGSVRNFVGWS